MPKRLAAAVATTLSAVTAAAALVVTQPLPTSAATGGFDFTRAQVATTGLQVPWGIAFLPDGSALVSERDTATIAQVRPGSAPTRVATVPNVAPQGEGGLLGIAVSPTYAQDQWVYAYFSSASDNRVVRFRLNAPQTQQVILSGIPRAQFHNGGRIAFGPDGMLYVTTGDAGTSANAQNLNSPGGKILRMRPDGTVPADNPISGSRVYSYGHRNVQGIAWDENGRLYATEFGQNTWDEINYIQPGRNYGWPTCEGVCSDSRFTNPIQTWSTSESSPSGLAYANGTLFAAALGGKRLWTLPVGAGSRTGNAAAEFQGTYGRLRIAAVGPDGWLWVATSNRDGRGAPTGDDDRIIRVPPAGGSSPSPSASPGPTVSPSPRVSPSASPAAGRRACSAAYEISNQWPGGFQGGLTVRNSGSVPISSWTVTFTFPNGQSITQLWGGRYTQSGSTVTVTNESWNGSLEPGAATTAGFTGSWTGGANGTPAPVTCTAS
ncbi:PQQ-dependent sugar dehydrogenase [Microbispora hainanensis]|uniref:PQQ-dependent sugar dehydrogenase n=1 Tax=Microbispora hainanensis TaxID=568844 RepID=A0ABZ1SYD2_9ACTN|nr:PQQ-dependent sugar dehydrogenase [Microbispora hainanensis]